jgi:cytochrome c-type biogenesis protein CcmH/NrfF
MSPHLVWWLLAVGILLGVGMLLGRFIRRRQREHMQRLKAELTARHREKLG